MSAYPREQPDDGDRRGLVRGIKNALLIVAVLYGGIVLAMIVVRNWAGWP